MAARARMRLAVQNEDGVAALEFAIALPILMTLMLSGIQLVTYVNAVRKVELVANSISEMISQAAPPTGSSTATVTTADLSFASDSAVVIFPYLLKDAKTQGVTAGSNISINYASVQFTQILTTCAGQADQSLCYAAKVGWTSSGIPGSNYRPCLPLQLPSDDTTVPNRFTLPRSVFGPGSLIAVDIVFNFKPTFGSGFIPSVRIARSVYIQPRYASLINFNTAGSNGTVSTCL